MEESPHSVIPVHYPFSFHHTHSGLPLPGGESPTVDIIPRGAGQTPVVTFLIALQFTYLCLENLRRSLQED